MNRKGRGRLFFLFSVLSHLVYILWRALRLRAFFELIGLYEVMAQQGPVKDKFFYEIEWEG